MKGKNCQQLNEIHIYFWIIGKRVKIDNFKNIIMKRVLCRQFRNTYVEMCLFLRFEIEQTSSEVSILKNRRYNINVEPSRAPQKNSSVPPLAMKLICFSTDGMTESLW